MMIPCSACGQGHEADLPGGHVVCPTCTPAPGTVTELSPCPFCEGPAVPIIIRGVAGGVFPDSELADPDGLYASAFVFCHECGAQSGSVEDIVFDRADCDALQRKAIAMWQQRNARHRALHDAGVRNGLNLFPRDDDSTRSA